MTVIDLFAGPGGWDVAALALGLDPLGVEWDDAAVRTREAAGLRTVQGDVSELHPLLYGPCDGLIASPPCQAFSMAGKGEGRKAIEVYRAAMSEAGWDRGRLDAACGDPRAHLVLEPLRWARALRPQWVACEQVEPVLPVWEAMAAALKWEGYQTWCGVLSSECFGVPQTRKRAILLASLDGPVNRPAPTHQRYIAPRKRDSQETSLFDAPEPERVVHPEDRQLVPWVSMAEAFGWGMTARPYPVIASGMSGATDREHVGGSTARARIYGERGAGRWRFRATNRSARENSGGDQHGAERQLDEPAPSLAFGHNPPRWVLNAGTGEHEAHRSADQSAPTLRFGARLNAVTWTLHTNRGQQEDGSRQTRDAGAPAPSLTAKSGGQWKVEQDGRAAVRLSIQEALILQSFPPDFPLQGTKTKQFEQCGNAIPPLLAYAALSAVITTTEATP